jgi:DNA-binding transcriptional MerR regulator
MGNYLTCGQAAKKLRVSISTLKRWVGEPDLGIDELRNRNGWRLFSEEDLGHLRDYKRQIKRGGKRFADITLLPINTQNSDRSQTSPSNIKAIA